MLAVVIIAATDDPTANCSAWRGYCCSPQWFCGTPDDYALYLRTFSPPPCPAPPAGGCPAAPKPGNGECRYWPLSGQCSFTLPLTGKIKFQSGILRDVHTGRVQCVVILS